MLIKHKILQELYQVRLLGKTDVIIFEAPVYLEILRKTIKGNNHVFYAALEALHKSGEINFDCIDNMVFITSHGIESLSSEKYKIDYIRWRREKVFFYLKLIGGIATILTIISAIIANFFTKV